MPDQNTSGGVDPTEADAWSTAFNAQATGTNVPRSQARRLEQVARTAGSGADPDAHAEALTSAIHGMAAIGPRNELEGMLVSQMVAAHENAMKCLFFAAESLVSPETREQEMRYATKLMQIFAQQTGVLAKLRASDLFENYQALKGVKNPHAPGKRKPGGSLD